jgi:hypothetical protein
MANQAAPRSLPSVETIPARTAPPVTTSRDTKLGAVTTGVPRAAHPGGSGLRPARMKLLLVAAITGISYRVLRCARACDAEIYVMGNLGARDLALSRHCARFMVSHAIINGSFDEGLALEINCLARELGVAMVLPADAPSTRALIACRHLLEVPCFPLPDLQQFDLLNNKWHFARLCDELGIRRPAARLFPDVEALKDEISAGRIAGPAVVKPLTLAGGQGQFMLNGDAASTPLTRINYRPILVQEFIAGRDICASIYCCSGEVTALVAYRNWKRVHSTFWSEAILEDLQHIAAYMNLDGVHCFDMIDGDDGKIYYLECNPRFYNSINLSMLAGINFVALGLRASREPGLIRVPHGTKVHAPEAALLSPRSWPALTRRDWAAARYTLSDLFYCIFEEFRWLA